MKIENYKLELKFKDVNKRSLFSILHSPFSIKPLLLLLVIVLLTIGCTTLERENPFDSGSDSYTGGHSGNSSGLEQSSSSSSSSSSGFEYGTLIYGGITYKTIRIGSQTWMAENLNYKTNTNNEGNSYCYNDSESNCDVYGRLYDYETAMRVCPGGWHLPGNAEWDVLISNAGGEAVAGTNLKAANGFDNKGNGESGNGADKYGFAALPGGFGAYGLSENYNNMGKIGLWWTSTSGSEGTKAYMRMIGSEDDKVGTGLDDIGYNASVRCVKN